MKCSYMEKCASFLLKRRRFLKEAGVFAGSCAGLCSGDPASKKRSSKGIKVAVVFFADNRIRDSWPYPGFDCKSREQEVLAALRKGCPQVTFIPVEVCQPKDASDALVLRDRVDAYLLYTVTLAWRLTGTFVQLGSLGKPTLAANEFFGGCGVFLTGLSRLRRAGAPVVGISSSRLSDLVTVSRCFQELRGKRLSPSAFAQRCEAAYLKTFGSPETEPCRRDHVKIRDIGECIRRFQSSRFLIVGRGKAGREQRFLGATGIFVGFKDVMDLYKKVDPQQAAAWAEKWRKEAQYVRGPEPEALIRAARLYLAIKELMKKYDTDSITINCLAGFASGRLPAYPCLGFMEILNSGGQGVCEAMVDDSLSMLMARILTGRPGYVSDPTLDTSQRNIVYAHCMATTKVFGPHGPSVPYRILTLHNRDPRGCCLQSLLPGGYMTTSFRTNFRTRTFVIHQAKALGPMNLDRGCRTKLVAHVIGDIRKLFYEWDRFGWHRVTVYGDLKEPLIEFAKALGLRVVEET